MHGHVQRVVWVGRLARLFRIGAPRASSSSDGHALVDAMVALLIISTTVVLSLHALATARRAAIAAAEVRGAHTLLNHLMLAGARQFEPTGGRTSGFAWRLETTPTGAEAPVEVCRRVAHAVHERSKRAYELSTLETCPAVEPAA